jgi:hypothetical protein
MTTVINGSSPSITFSDSTTQTTAFTTTPVINTINSQASTPLTLGINSTEAMRIDSNGNLLVGTTTAYGTGLTLSGSGTQIVTNFGSAYTCASFRTASVQYGYITTSSSGTVYSTSSDYRLKENIALMTGALAKVAQLKPVTYKWKTDGSDGQGFIAHELDKVVPDCVTGEKDAVDAEGKPVYQGIDTSFLIATLTAAIQEQQALIESLTTRLTALESK